MYVLSVVASIHVCMYVCICVMRAYVHERMHVCICVCGVCDVCKRMQAFNSYNVCGLYAVVHACMRPCIYVMNSCRYARIHM